jgi:hypothetical protein
MKRRVSFGMDLAPRPRTEAQLEAARKALELTRADPPRGSRNGASKLTEEQVLKIRALHSAGERPSVLSLRFAVDRTLIWHITTRKIWTHV